MTGSPCRAAGAAKCPELHPTEVWSQIRGGARGVQRNGAALDHSIASTRPVGSLVRGNPAGR
jgi:hypothetical protein